MTAYLVKRLLLAVPVLLGITLIVFSAIRLAPGDAATIAGYDAGGGLVVDALRKEYGLDLSIPEQYLAYMSHVLRFDLGRSNYTHVPVAEELAARLPVTFAVAVAATLLATLVGITLGVLAACYQHSWVDYVVSVSAIAWLSVPNYVLGIVLVLVFAVFLGVLPATGAETPLSFVLPVLTVAALGSGALVRQTRAAMLEVLGEDYIRTARAKGLSATTVLRRHALRNALIPVLTTAGVIFGSLMGGAVIVENVFAIPGLGKLLVDRIAVRDYPAVQGTVLLIASSYVFVNLVIDFAYVVADRRVRLK